MVCLFLFSSTAIFIIYLISSDVCWYPKYKFICPFIYIFHTMYFNQIFCLTSTPPRFSKAKQNQKSKIQKTKLVRQTPPAPPPKNTCCPSSVGLLPSQGACLGMWLTDSITLH